jgi:hypothetical protein
MSEENETLVRGAYEAYGRGDVTTLLDEARSFTSEDGPR